MGHPVLWLQDAQQTPGVSLHELLQSTDTAGHSRQPAPLMATGHPVLLCSIQAARNKLVLFDPDIPGLCPSWVMFPTQLCLSSDSFSKAKFFLHLQ